LTPFTMNDPEFQRLLQDCRQAPGDLLAASDGKEAGERILDSARRRAASSLA